MPITTTEPVEHHGSTISAEKIDDHYWRPILDGDFYGTKTYLSSRDALAAARRVAERRAGIVAEPVERMLADPDAAWADEYRDRLRDRLAS